MADIVLNVETRERTGTGGAREARRSGLVPGVIYGGKDAPAAVAVKVNSTTHDSASVDGWIRWL